MWRQPSPNPSHYSSIKLRWTVLTSGVPSVSPVWEKKKQSIFQRNLMTLLFSRRETVHCPSLWFPPLLPLPRGWWINAFAGSAHPKVYLYPGDAFIGGGCHREMALLTLDSWGANVWKKAWAGDSAQSSPECCGSRNIRSLKCFLKHFLQEAPGPTFISLSLSLYFSPSLAFIPCPPNLPPHTPPFPHLSSSAPKTSSSARAAVLLFLCAVLRAARQTRAGRRDYWGASAFLSYFFFFQLLHSL